MKAIAPSLRRNAFFQVLVLVTLAPGLILSPLPVSANPQGPNIVAGNVNFRGLGTAQLDINNASQRAIINWQSFSINRGEVTRINQASNAFTLNRVVSGNPTAIYGQLKAARGGVMVVNPNGIVVHQGGSVDVAGMLTLSTLDIGDEDFLDGGSNRFKGNTAAGVRNYGAISSSDGDVVLLGNFLQNAGSVSAPRGVVAFGAGGDIVVDQAGGAKISVLAGGSGGERGIDNSGTIDAAAAELKAHGNVYALAIKNDGLVRASGYHFGGGRLTLNAGPQGRVVNTGQLVARNADGSGGRIEISGGRVELQSGTVDASGAVGRAGGEVEVSGSSVEVGSLSAVRVSGSTGGRVMVHAASEATVEGSVEAVGHAAAGGSVTIEGSEIAIADGARIDVSGETGGGIAQIGGGFQGRDAAIRNAESLTIDDGATIAADAVGSGKGGNVILWSDGRTEFAGTLSARGVEQGGFAEISGKSTLDVTGDVDLTAASGKGGTLLLDPTDITISAEGASGLGGNTISNVWISGQLDAGTDVIVSTNIGGNEAGHITIGRLTSTLDAYADRILWYQDDAGTTPGTLSLLAMGDIYFNTAVQSAGEGGINVVAGWDGTTGLTMGNPFDMAAVLATMNDGDPSNDAAGLLGGSVHVGNTGARLGVSVGSRWGDTNVAARDLMLRGSITIGLGWAQLGFNDTGVEYELSKVQNGVTLNEWWGSPLGNVQGKNYIALLGGTEFGTGDINGLGDNAFRGAGWGAKGNITVDLSGRLDARGGTSNGFTQIGHGGNMSEGVEYKWHTSTNNTTYKPELITRDGIDIDPGSNRYSYYSTSWRTNYAGDDARVDADIFVEAAGDVLMMGSRGFEAADNQSSVLTSNIYTMIGHGGAENQGSYHGDVTVIAHGKTPSGYDRGPEGLGIQMIGGRATRSFAKIGHGSGYEGNPRSIWDQTNSGDVTVVATTGAIRLFGHNQAIRDGDVNFGAIVPEGVPTPYANSSDASYLGSYVQIGHGGQAGVYGAAGGTFMMPGGVNVNNIVPNNSISGDIHVYAAGTFIDPRDPAAGPIGIQVRAGNRRWFFAMIGHGGTNKKADHTVAQTPDFGAGASLPTLSADPYEAPTVAQPIGFQGNIHVEADQGSVVTKGGDSFRADRSWGWGYNFAQIGHGGVVSRGPKGGTITVLAGQGAGATSGDILFQAGQMNLSHAMLGHGGYDSDSALVGGWDSATKTAIVGDNTAEIVVKAHGSISFISPRGGETDALGLSADYAYFWYNNAAADGTPQSGNGSWSTSDRFVQLGHGGYASTTVIPDRQDITVISGTGDLENADEDESTGGVTFIAGDTTRAYAQLGHGGHSASANNEAGFTGDITVRANGGGVRFDGSIQGAMNVSRVTDVSRNGVDTVQPSYTTGAGTTVVGAVMRGVGVGADTYVHLGHGGLGARGFHSGDIVIDAWGGLDFLGAPAAPKVDQRVENRLINPALGAGTNVWVPLGNFIDTQIVHTPANNQYQQPQLFSNVVPGSLMIVLSNGDVITDLPNATSDDRTSSLVLNGTTTIGQISYDNGLVRFQQGGAAGAIVTGLTDDAVVTFQTATGIKDRAYVQLGHGGYDADGPNNKANNLPTASGDITIHAGGDIRFEAGAAYRNYAQLGHGGLETRGAKSGDITIDHVDATHRVGGLVFTAGHGGHRQYDYNSYVQLGHGGYDADGNMFGNIFIRGTETGIGIGMLFKAGDRKDAFAQLGHGGFNARSGTGNGADSFGMNGDIDVEVTGDAAFVAGTFTKNNEPWTDGDDDNGRLYVMLGHGGYNSDPSAGDTTNFDQVRIDPSLPAGTAGAGEGSWGHFGDIRLVSHNGDVSFMAGSNIPVANRLDFDGNPLQIDDPLGILTSYGSGGGRIHWAQAGHGGYHTGGNHAGDITISAGGNVNVVGGMFTSEGSTQQLHYAQIGHGASNAQGHIGGPDSFIKVHALGGNVVVVGGDARTNSAQVGHGGTHTSSGMNGNLDAYISVIAGNNLQLNSGVGSHDTNWGKIGHSDVRNFSNGLRSGDIHVSVGNTMTMGRAVLGHLDYRLAVGYYGAAEGDTFIAVGRKNPHAGGPGELVTTADSVITSVGGGTAGELRLYMPDASSNRIAEGTFLNSGDYTRTPAPGSNRADEQYATEHHYPEGPITEADAAFTPEGAYPFHGFGLYNVYYGGEAPPEIPTVPPGPTVPTDPTLPPGPPVDPGLPPFDFGPYAFDDTYDAFFRYEELFLYDGYDEALSSLAYRDALEDGSPVRVGSTFLEEVLDGSFGPRSHREIAPGSTVLDDEDDEERLRRKRRAARQVGKGALTYYVFDPATNRYSSYRVFGVEQTRLSVTQ